MSEHSAEEDAVSLDGALSTPEGVAAFEDWSVRHTALDVLLARRHATGLTQTHVGALMGVKQPTVSEFEAESSDPRLSTLQRYARAVGLRVTISFDVIVPLDNYVTPPGEVTR